jgi:hypothetical protein
VCAVASAGVVTRGVVAIVLPPGAGAV